MSRVHSSSSPLAYPKCQGKEDLASHSVCLEDSYNFILQQEIPHGSLLDMRDLDALCPRLVCQT